MAVARRRGLDTIRRRVTFERNVEQIGRDLTELENPMDDIEIEPTVHDDVLRLTFTASHPVLSSEARVALTLKMIGGLSTGEIARAFVVPVPTMAQRIVRAKKALSDAGVPFEIPTGDALAERFSSVAGENDVPGVQFGAAGGQHVCQPGGRMQRGPHHGGGVECRSAGVRPSSWSAIVCTSMSLMH